MASEDYSIGEFSRYCGIIIIHTDRIGISHSIRPRRDAMGLFCYSVIALLHFSDRSRVSMNFTILTRRNLIND